MGNAALLDKKVATGIYIDKWMLETIDGIGKKRSNMFRWLLIEVLKEEKLYIGEKLKELDESDVVRLRHNIMETWSKDVLHYQHKKTPWKTSDHYTKKGVSLSLDQWIIDLAYLVEPNRTIFFSALLLRKIKKELLRLELIEEDTVIKKCHGDLFLLNKKRINLKAGEE
ncbi:hypothetical protein [Peribacillus sp. SCS-155]|uniref:hypothetical protein n=1 Tax=Peribacillus sedimenti TaxID=3115297 RepID=UPI00390665DA